MPETSLCERAHRGKVMWGHSKKVAVYEPGREASRETNPAGTLTLDIQPPELGENKRLLFKPLSL